MASQTNNPQNEEWSFGVVQVVTICALACLELF